MIKVENKNGSVCFDEMEIIMFIEEQIKLIPGVLFYKNNGIIKTLREILKLSTNKVKISQINPNEIFISISIVMSKEVNYLNVEKEVYELLEYSLQKKYGLKINNIEINIENLV